MPPAHPNHPIPTLPSPRAAWKGATALSLGLVLGLAGSAPLLASGQGKPGDPKQPQARQATNQASAMFQRLLAQVFNAQTAAPAESGATQPRPSRQETKASPDPEAAATIQTMMDLLKSMEGFTPAPDKVVAVPVSHNVPPGLRPTRPAESQVVANAVLPMADVSHMDLHGRDLTRLVLKDGDASWADLRNSLLIEGKFSGTNFHQAKLAGACLFMANVADTRGLNLEKSGVLLHPFFQKASGPGVTIKEYLLPDPAYRPRQIVVGSTGDLFLLEPGKSRFWIVSPTGLADTLDGDDPRGFLALARDTRNQVWVFGTESYSSMVDTVLRGPLDASHAAPLEFGKALTAVAGAKGQMFLAQPGCFTEFSRERLASGAQWRTRSLGTVSLQSLAVTSDHKVLAGVQPEFDQVAIVNTTTWQTQTVKLRSGSRPGCVAAGAGGQVWFTAPGNNQIGVIQVAHGKAGQPDYVLPEDSKDRGLHSLAQGPDGCMWFTQQKPAAIGRVKADGQVGELMLLPPGMVPETLVAGRHGEMLFTLAGRGAIASITPAREPQAEGHDAKAVADSFVSPEYRPRPERLSGQARREAAMRPLVPSVAQARPAGARDAKSSSASLETKAADSKADSVEPLSHPVESAASAEEPVRSEATSAATETPRRTARKILEDDHNLYMEDERIQHILDGHSWGVDTDDSWFNAELCRPETIAELVLQAVRANGGEIGKTLKRFDPRGMGHTVAGLDQVIGQYLDLRARPWNTRSLDVVTWEVPLQDGTTAYRLVSAYPISPTRYD